ncbi:DUF4097 family beta strand repeat-containing protein [Winogradskya consettensis]|uniref:DUF4097 domain-containing protein n=1 Tax=Winogradskya consettensis TaxID=113560 RepID=A0A919SLS3_9ACTN|nr:DUF4097 family beta strand repeat-containing protein [Actinoplanes consettensis]GIM74767.1 hypothetical protein Aco04nite_41950 [Actinoplanes consettensis]
MPSFDTPQPIRATLEMSVGDVRLAASDRPDTVVDVRPSNPASERDVQAAEQTRVEFSDGHLLIRTPKARGIGMLGVLGKPGSVDIDIALPTGSGMHLTSALGAVHSTGELGTTYIKTAAGDVRLERTGTLDLTTAAGEVVVDRANGDVRITTASGTVDVIEIRGNAVVKNSNGATRISRVAGNLRVANANGDIVVGSAAADVNASTASGSIRVDEVSHGSVSVKTAAGSLRVGVARGTAVYLDLNTTFGKVSSELAESGAPEPGEGRVELKARTSFGSIEVFRAAAATGAGAE